MQLLTDAPPPPLEALALMEPCRGTLPFSSAAWSFSLPVQGYRMLAAFGFGGGAGDAGCRLRSRQGVDASRWFPEVVAALSALKLARTVVDGEVCVLDAAGRCDARQLHARALRPGRRPGTSAAVLCLQDLLVWRGADVRALPWSQRRQLLASLPLRDQGALRLQRTVPGEGQWMWRQAQALGLDCVHAYRRDAPYQGGRSIGWLCIPCTPQAAARMG